MTQTKDKYSLVIVPRGEVREQLQTLIEDLALHNNAPAFTPHITVVSNIFAAPDELAHERDKAIELANKVGKFTVTLHKYGFLNEEFRCLFLLAHSEAFESVYANAATIYPQVNNQHFRQLPHLSVLYGTYPQETKDRIIADHPMPPLEFDVESFDLYKTNGPASSWQLDE
jgi:hypothetical protein